MVSNRTNHTHPHPPPITRNYRKIRKTLIRDSLMDYLKTNNILSRLQFGFFFSLDHWTETLNRGGNVDVVYYDFLKAFDKVPHNYKRMIPKLELYGFQIECFLG